ncbi:MAG: VIT and VWA domain-containing protein [Cellvibrionaceae bacterium]
MKHVLATVFRFTLAGGALLLSGAASAAGLMTPADSGLPPLDLTEHRVNVQVEDGYAITQVEQVFSNPHAQDLEAIYSFPVPEKAAVGEFTYWIDGKPVSGEVLEKQQAREIYEQEKSQGRETAITEQDSYKTFDISVFPVRSQSDVRIRLAYMQPVHVDSGIGRYVYPLEEGGVDEERMAFWSYNDAVSAVFSFDMTVRSSYPIDGLHFPNQPQAITTAVSDQVWSASLANHSGAAAQEEQGQVQSVTPQVVKGLDQDLVVYWRHQAGLPGSIDMVSHKGPGDSRGTFMLTVTPGDDLAPIKAGRDWVFVLDLSGSMQGKYHTLVEGVNKGLSKLKPEDRFRVVLFNNSARELTRGYVAATPANVQNYLQQLEATQPNGGTNLYAGLEKGIKGLDSDRASAIILVTDGVANVGVTEKKAFLTLLEKYDVRLFTFVMGNSANRPLLDGMTNISNGFAVSVSNSDDIIGQLMLATDKLNHEALRDVEVKIKGVKVRDLSPARIGSLYRGQQLIVLGHYWGSGSADIEISGKISGQKKSYSTQVTFPEQSTLNPEIERLWAFATIEDLQQSIDYLGEDADTKQAIVDIAKEYGLVTDYTSMLVVRDKVFQQYNIERNNTKRVAEEHAARQQRTDAGVRDHRQDAQQPAFNGPRAYPKSGGGSGGGALGFWTLLLLAPLLFLRRQVA